MDRVSFFATPSGRGIGLGVEPATGDVWVMGAAIEIGENGLAVGIEPFQVQASG